MGLRYTKIGQDRNETTIVQGPLADILLAKQVPGTKAWADDIPGVALEWKVTDAYPTGAWFGNMGVFGTAAEAASYVAVMGLVASGVSASVASVPSVYQPGVGRVAGFDDDALLVIGDSRVAYEGGYTTDGTLRNVAYGHAGSVNWMQQLLGDFRFKRLHLRGRSGIRAFDVATGAVQGWDFASILASSDARHVLIRLGTNDLNLANTFTADEIYGYICTIVDAALKQGRTVHVSTVEPRDLIGGYVAANTIRGVTLNLLLQSISYRRERAFCVDVTKQFTDFAQTTKCTPIISAAASVVHDGLHPSIRGAYTIGLALKNHFSAFRRDAFQYGSIHFLDTKANGATGRKQLIAGPLMNTGMNTIARTGFTYSTVTAPNGVGSALRVDVDASSGTSWPIGIAYQDIQITNSDFQAGSTLYGYARIRVSGPGGTGTPNLLKGIAISAQVDRNGSTGFVQGADACRTDPDSSGGYANASVCEFTGDLLLVTPKFTFLGGETYSLPYLWFFVKSLAGASYRLEIYDAGVILEKAGTPDPFPQFWSDATPPVAIP